MKLYKKIIVSMIISIVMILLFVKNSYGILVYSHGNFDQDIKSLLNQQIWQNGWSSGSNNCSQANNDSGYSWKIQAVYETLYDKTTGRIVATSQSNVSEGGGSFSKADDKSIRSFAAAMSLDSNIQGVRSALMKCINSGKAARSSTLMSNNNSGGTYAGSSAAWEKANKDLKEKYENYQNLQKVDIANEVKVSEKTLDGTEYIYMGPFKMKYGSAGIDDMLINGESVKGQGAIKYRIAGLTSSNDMSSYSGNFNELKDNSKSSYKLSNKNFYLIVKKSKIAEVLGNEASGTIKIQFTQKKFSYKRGRTFVCNQYTGVQGNVWYANKSDEIEGGKATFTVKISLDGELIIQKKAEGAKNNKMTFIVITKSKEGGDYKFLAQNGTKYNYESNTPTEFTTNEDGYKKLTKLSNSYQYRVVEIKAPEGCDITKQDYYSTNVSKTGIAGVPASWTDAGKTITMNNKPELIKIKVNKIWKDENSSSRPASIKVTLSGGGAVINSSGKTSITKTISSSNTVTFTNLYRYDKNGTPIKYTIQEVVPEGYSVSYSPQTITTDNKISEYEFNITNQGGKTEEQTPNAGDLLIEKEGGNMSFMVWEDSKPQWIKKITRTYESGTTVPENKLEGVTYSLKAKIDEGTQLGSYIYTHYSVYETERRSRTEIINKVDENGNIIKDENGNPVTEEKIVYYNYYYYEKIIENIECVHKKTNEWHGGEYTTTSGKYKLTGLYPGTYTIYETKCDKYYDLELQSGYSDLGYHGISNIRLATSVTLGENESETIKLASSGKATVVNKRTRGDLEIEKLGESGEDMDDIEIIIYGEINEGGKHYSGWLTSQGSFEDVSWKNIGSIFTGSENSIYKTQGGSISITGLPLGTYYIYEKKTFSIEYALEGQGTPFDGTKVLLGSTQVTESGSFVSYKQKKRPTGDLIINKTGIYVNNNLVNSNVTEPLKNMAFILSSTAVDVGGWKTASQKWVYIRKNEKGQDIVDFTENKDEATVFVTDKSGCVTISGLYVDLGPYKLEEILHIDQDKYYTDEIEIDGDREVNISEGENIANVKNKRSSGDLKIEKVDDNYKDLKLQEVGFKLKLKTAEYVDASDLWIGNDGIYDYSGDGNTYDFYNATHDQYLVGDETEAITFVTNENGEINIKKIVNGIYEVWETTAPYGYDITRQDGYDPSTGMVYIGTVTISTNNNVVNYQITNKKVVDKLDGFVWVDEKDTKENKYDSIYKSGTKDSLRQGITVNLIDINTKEIKATSVTDNRGHYEFEKYADGTDIIYWDLAHSYVEFIYNNKEYIIVNPFEGGNNQIPFNSKAQAEEIKTEELDDANLTGTENPYPGRAITCKAVGELGYQEILDQRETASIEDKLLTAYYDDNTFRIEYINLGLVEKAVTDHSIAESIEYVKIVKGGYTFTYKYGEEAVTEEGSPQSTVKFQNSKKSFTQSIYPSDIKYNLANDLNGNKESTFKVYVVYKIDIKNLTTTNNEDLYVEKALYLDNLTNTYDMSRYKISHDILDGDDKNISNDFGLWDDTDNSGTAKFNINSSNKKYKNGNEGIKPLEIETTYIEFRVTDEALTKLVTEEQLSSSPTIAKSYGYHIYERKDKNWKNKDTYTHKTIIEERENGSLFLKWKLMQTRKFSGTVFEDTKTNKLDGEANNSRQYERVGDGKYTEGTEKTLTDVLVTLLDADSGEIANLYDGELTQTISTGKWTSNKQQAITKVDENGNYTFVGLIPGKYYLQFTYGDGKTTYKDLNGQEINVSTKIKGQTSPINSNYYKSTILTGSARNATVENENSWFLRSITEEVYSVATDYTGIYYDIDGNVKEQDTDIINSRISSTKEINNTSAKDKVVINARSPKMDINFEYLGEPSINYNDENLLNTDCTGMYFGIIEKPHVEITLDKTISNVKLILSNGTSIINGNPKNMNVSKYLTSITNSYAKVEGNTSDLYGSTLTVTYKLTATNKSELDYASAEYYKKGIIDNQKLVKTAVTKIINYVDKKNCNYVDKSENVKYLNDYDDEGYTKEDYFAENVIDSNKKYKEQLLSLTGEIEPVYANKEKSSIDYFISVNNLLSSIDDNLGWNSYSEIIGLKNATYTSQYISHLGSYKAGDTVKYPEGTSEADNADAVIAIVPSTGKNKSYSIYIITGMVLIILAIGIIMIKKFVL